MHKSFYNSHASKKLVYTYDRMLELTGLSGGLDLMKSSITA
jgi:hypothetical protein